uniref:Thioesterase domain-containing protein n=1 Tax=Neogobius melanostomus TaxID=47308 RepID=A0A8C6U2T9_9GOBI
RGFSDIFGRVWLPRPGNPETDQPSRCPQLKGAGEAGGDLSEVQLRFFIVSGLRSLHGEVGAALNFDVLQHDEASNIAVLKVPKEGLVKLWSSLTLLGSYMEQRCAFRVLQVNGLISALLGSNSPGCVLLKQQIRFPAPLFVGEAVSARAEVQRVRLSTAVVSVRVQTADQTEETRVVLEGTITVKIHKKQEIG